VAISGVTPDGRLYIQAQQHAFRSDRVAHCLEHLLRHVSGKSLVIWDGSSMHRSQVSKGFLARGPGERIYLERSPGYAPDLNPDKGIWNYLKRVELRNVYCRDLAQLRSELGKATERLWQKKQVVEACIRQPGYTEPPMLGLVGSPFLVACEQTREPDWRKGFGPVPDLLSRLSVAPLQRALAVAGKDRPGTQALVHFHVSQGEVWLRGCQAWHCQHQDQVSQAAERADQE
jgi:transposase